MELSELQKRVDTWIREYGVRYFSELTNMAILTEEDMVHFQNLPLHI